MSVHCFTSFTFSYLNRARVLGETLKRQHPDWPLTAVITDSPPQWFRFDLASEPFDHVIWGDEIMGPAARAWLYKHDIVEACTAVKGPVIERLLAGGAERVLYFDPDIAIFESLEPVAQRLEDASILLTPHQLEPDDPEGSVRDNEICSLQHGVYNLGFVGVRNDAEGRRFARWWSDRLSRFCYDDKPAGLFVDQKWCDLIPAFFERVHIVRDPGCNVASWNLNRRTASIDRSGRILINGQPLRFFHFTKLGVTGDMMTERYARDNVEVYEIWAWYRRRVEELTDERIPARWWGYGHYASGEDISPAARRLYRARTDLQEAFPDPFLTGPGTYKAWLEAHGTHS